MEAEVGGYSYLTDSGRSSLRLILQSIGRRKYLLPNYLCQTVLDIFDSVQIEYSFYNIREDLSCDIRGLLPRDFGALYIIDYFGQRDDSYASVVDNDMIVLHDQVFQPFVERPPWCVNWVGFNSLRKISPVADGSIIKSTFKLRDDLIRKEEAPFSAMKYHAKNAKYRRLQTGVHDNQDYMALFEEAEGLLQNQKDAYRISMRSELKAFEFYGCLESEYSKRRQNYKLIEELLGGYGIKIDARYPSFYVLRIRERDALRRHLSDHSIYLPVHWKKPVKTDSAFYDKVISIPLDSRYSVGDMNSIAKMIQEFFSNEG